MVIMVLDMLSSSKAIFSLLKFSVAQDDSNAGRIRRGRRRKNCLGSFMLLCPRPRAPFSISSSNRPSPRPLPGLSASCARSFWISMWRVWISFPFSCWSNSLYILYLLFAAGMLPEARRKRLSSKSNALENTFRQVFFNVKTMF